MTMIRQDSRMRVHRLTGTQSFTAPLSEDFTDGSWTKTDLFKGEFGVQIDQDRVFTRTNNGILELATGRGMNRIQATASQPAGVTTTIWNYTALVPNENITIKVVLSGIANDGGTASSFVSAEIFGAFSTDAGATASLITASTYDIKSSGGDTYLIKLDIDSSVPALIVNALTYDHQWLASIEYQTIKL